MSRRSFNKNNNRDKYFNSYGIDTRKVIGSNSFNNLIDDYQEHTIDSSRNKIFRNHDQNFKWKELMKINSNYIKQNNDLNPLEPYVENLLYSNFRDGELQIIPEDYIYQLVNLLQTTGEYLFYVQEKLEEQNSMLNLKMQDYDNLKQNEENNKRIINNLKRENKEKDLLLMTYQNIIKNGQNYHMNNNNLKNNNLNNINESNNEDLISDSEEEGKRNVFCELCSGKKFKSEKQLREHMQRRHLIEYDTFKKGKNKNQSIDDKIEEMKIYFNNLIMNNQIRGDYNLLNNKIDDLQNSLSGRNLQFPMQNMNNNQSKTVIIDNQPEILRSRKGNNNSSNLIINSLNQMNNNIMRNNQNTNEQMNKLQNELNSFQRNINDQIYNLKKNPNVNISSTLKKSSIIGNSRYTNEGNDLQTRFQNVKAPQININQNQDPNFKNSYNQNNENNKQIKIEKHNKYIINKQIINEHPLESSDIKNSQFDNRNSQINEIKQQQLRGGNKNLEYKIRYFENEKIKEINKDVDPREALEYFYQRFTDRDNNINKDDINTYLLKVIPSNNDLSENAIIQIMDEEIDKTLQNVNKNKDITRRFLKNEKNVEKLNEIYLNSYNEKNKNASNNQYYEVYNRLIDETVNTPDNINFANEIYDDYVNRKNNINNNVSIYKSNISYNRNIQNNNNFNYSNLNYNNNLNNSNNQFNNNSKISNSPNKKLNNIPTFGDEEEKNINFIEDKKVDDENDSEFDHS